MSSPFSSTPTQGYDPLPTSEWGAGRPVPLSVRASRLFKRRRVFYALVALATVVIFIALVARSPARLKEWRQKQTAEKEPEKPQILPPLYPEYHIEELRLPHQDTRNPFANGRKYMWVADHTQSGSGWGNFMQDMIFNAQLVYESGRSFVFDNYTWDRDGPEYTNWNGRMIPSRIPLSALISGPIAGGPFGEDDPTPRAVTKEYWDEICPNRTLIRADEVRKLHGDGANARKIMDTWLDYVKQIDDPCLEVDRNSGSIFHVFMFGTPDEILPAWPTLSQSPILRLFGWGTLAHRAFESNRHLFAPAPLIAPYETRPGCLNCVDPYAQLDGLLALHIRRGDFLDHCINLGHWGAGFNALNSFPEFVDQWTPPQGTEEERIAVYLRRCLPTIEQIVEKVEAVRGSRAGEGLRNIYIMSNGDPQWLDELKAALRAAHSWDLIATTRDLIFTPEEKYVSQTMDMLIGQRAQVLVGNGFSSMTSNIAMLRQARRMPADSTRMW